tara:strand:- start:932 stop:1165 length:234 start_codon:yes stop_codon:yes gene_type:complete
MILEIIFNLIFIVGFALCVKPIIDNIVMFFSDTWFLYQDWDKRRIEKKMGIDTWDEDIMRADYDKYDDPFYIEEKEG